MAKVVVVGAGIAGLACALVLARGGQEVVLFEQDRARVPDEVEQMWSAWDRPGTPQAHYLHAFGAGARKVLHQRAPDVLARLVEAGAAESDVAARAPDGPGQPGDEDLVMVRARRPVFEGVLRRLVEAEPNAQVRTGGIVDSLRVTPSTMDGVPQVVGVGVAGQVIDADVVVDASGRRSRVRDWLEAIGAPAPTEESGDSGVVYYGRYFRLLPGAETGTDLMRRVRGDLGYMGYVVGGSDNRTFVINLTVPVWDRELRVLRHEAAWMAAVRRIPVLAPLVEAARATPIGPVEPMGHLRNTLRRFTVGGRPVTLGLHVIGDALCQTNPTYGKGMVLGMRHAFALADAIQAAPTDPARQAADLDGAIGDEARLSYEYAVAADASRARRWRGELREPPTPTTDVHGFIRLVMPRAAARDGAVYRALMRHTMNLDLPNVLIGNGALLDRAMALVTDESFRGTAPPAPQGPERAALLELAAAAVPAHSTAPTS